MNKWELLAAMQALSLYILVRLEEGENDHNNLDVLLFACFAVSYPHLHASIPRHPKP
jgi:hypothetical protein